MQNNASLAASRDSSSIISAANRVSGNRIVAISFVCVCDVRTVLHCARYAASVASIWSSHSSSRPILLSQGGNSDASILLRLRKILSSCAVLSRSTLSDASVASAANRHINPIDQRSSRPDKITSAINVSRSSVDAGAKPTVSGSISSSRFVRQYCREK